MPQPSASSRKPFLGTGSVSKLRPLVSDAGEVPPSLSGMRASNFQLPARQLPNIML